MRSRTPVRPLPPAGVKIRPRALESQPETELPGKGIRFSTPQDILDGGDAIQRAINANPALGGLFFVNPALVLRELGFEMTPEVEEHVNEALAQGGDVGQEIERLDAEIRLELGDDSAQWKLLAPKHLAEILFGKLKIAPRVTAGAEIAYQTPGASPRLAALRERTMRPRRILRVTPEARAKIKGMVVEIATHVPQVRFIDLDAEIPALPLAESPPEALEPKELFFYLDAHPLVRKLLQHAMAHDKRLYFRGEKHYQSVRDGELASPWRTWIQDIRYR